MSKNKAGASRPLYVVLIALGLFALYFAGLGSYPLLDADEPFYGQVAKEMAAGAGWFTPHLGGKVWFDKPPLLYWLIGGMISIFGPTEVACRLPSAILAVVLVLLVYKLASYDFGRRAAVFSAVVMATCVQQIVLARSAVTDVTFTVCLVSALYSYRRWLDREGRSRLGWAVLCGAMTGLGTLAKGPVAPLLIGAAVFIHLLWTGRLRRLLSLDVLAAVVVLFAIGAPWFIAMYSLHREAFVRDFLVMHNITRFLKPLHVDQTGSWTSYFRNIPVFFGFFFPWSVFLPQALRNGWKLNDGAKLATVWTAVIFIFFSISKTQLVTYIFPLYPMAAIFVGVLLSRASVNSEQASFDKLRMAENVRGGIRKALWAAICVAAAIGAVLIVGARRKYPEAEAAALALVAILVVFLAVAQVWMLRYKDGARRALWTIGAGMAVFALWLVYGVVPHAVPSACTRDMVKRLPDLSKMRVIEVRARHPSLTFYTGGVVPLHIPRMAEAKRLLAEEVPTVVVCYASDIEALTVPGLSKWAESGRLAIVGNRAAHSLKSQLPVTRRLR